MSDTISFLLAKQKVENDLDLRAENFISPGEMKDLFNQAIDFVEAEVHKLGLEDEYFLKQSAIPLVAGTQDYNMPADIYANKIKGLVFSESLTNTYEVRRVRGQKRFVDIKLTELFDSSTIDHRYIVVNNSANTPQIRLVPSAKITSTTALTIWYTRNAAKVVDDADLIDVPEFFSYIIQFVKNEIKIKEGTLNDVDIINLAREQKNMTDTLTEMIPDRDDFILADTEFYEEFSYPNYGGRHGI